MKLRFALSAAVVSISALLHTSAFSQTDAEPNAGRTSTQNCRANPANGQGNNENAGNTENLTEQLDRCNGVIKPPKVGDQEIVEPTPRVGTTPVIPPSALPEQNKDTVTGGNPSKTEKSIDAGSDVDQIVSAIANSSQVAE